MKNSHKVIIATVLGLCAGATVALAADKAAATIQPQPPVVISAASTASTASSAPAPKKDLLSRELTNLDIEKWKNATVKDPKDANAYFELAMAYSRSSYIEKAWPALQEVDKIDANFANKIIQKMNANLAKNPNDTESRYRLAFGYYFKGLKNNDNTFKQKAKDEFDRIIKQNPKHVWAINYRAYLYTEDGQLDKAISMWEMSLAIDKNNPVTHFVLGHAYYKKGRFKQALTEIGLAFDLRNKGY